MNSHGCSVQSHHFPVPHVLVDFYLVPVEWQEQIYGHVELPERVTFCPTHAENAKLAISAAVGQICFNQRSIYDRRQFGREIWSLAEDAALWLRERLQVHPGLNPRLTSSGRERSAPPPLPPER